jgi:hypothetical protein
MNSQLDDRSPAQQSKHAAAKRTTARAAAGYLAIVAVLFHRLLFGEVLSPAANLWVEVPFRSQASEDLTAHFNGIQGDVWRACDPWHIYQYRSARAGRFPLWNPTIFCGFPLHANAQSALLSPFHWLYFVCEPKWATGAIAALKLWLAGFASYCLGRRLGMSPLGAFLAGAAWMLSAFNVRWLQWPLSSATAWLPILLIAVESIMEQPNWRRFAIAGLATTALELSGHPECQFLVASLSMLYALLRVVWLKATWIEKASRVLMWLAVHVIGLLGAAAALLPFLEQMRGSADWQQATHAVRRYLPAEGVIGVIAPDHFGRPRAGRIMHDRLHVNYNEAGVYIGLLPAALAAAAIVRLITQPRRTVQGPVGAATAIFAVWLLSCAAVALGVPGFTHLAHALPLFSKTDTLRLLFGVQFAGAMLAGAAWTWLEQSPGRFMAWSTSICCAGVALLLLWVLLVPELPDLYSHREGLRVLWTDPTTPAPLDHRSLRTLVNFAISLILFAAVGLWARSTLRHPASRSGGTGSASVLAQNPSSSRGGLIVVGLAVGDLLFTAYGFNPIVPAKIVFPPAPDAIRRLAENAGHNRMIATDEILAPNLALVYGLRDLRGYDFPIDARLATLFQKLGWIGERASIVLLPRRFVFPCMAPSLQSVLDKACVRFLYSNLRRDGLAICDVPGREPTPPAWPLVQFGPGEDAVYENTTAYPRSYFARKVTTASSEAALEALLTIAHDLRQESFVESPLEGADLDPNSATGTVTIEVDGDEQVVLRTESDAPGLLVLSDRYDPGWRVEIDDRPATPLRANYLFRGVVVPAGSHVVRWTYRPMSFVVGSVVSVATLVVLTGLLFVPGRR